MLPTLIILSGIENSPRSGRGDDSLMKDSLRTSGTGLPVEVVIHLCIILQHLS